jgi:dihydrofolate reductase
VREPRQRAPRGTSSSFAKPRRVIVHIAASADGYIAGPGGDLEWLTSRPAPKGFYGINAFMKSIDTMVIGRMTYEVSLSIGGTFDPKSRTYVFSRNEPPADVPRGVEFVSGDVGEFVRRLRDRPGKDIWLMGGGELIASFLDAGAIDEFVVSVVPVFIGDGIPLIARRPRHTKLELMSTERFPDGLVQLRYRVTGSELPAPRPETRQPRPNRRTGSGGSSSETSPPSGGRGRASRRARRPR